MKLFFGILLAVVCALPAVLLFLTALVLVLPVRVRVRWHGAPQVWAGLGPVMLQLFPPKPRKKSKKPGKPRAAKKKPSKKTSKKPMFQLAKLTPSLLLEYAKLGKQTLGRMFGAIKISNLQLHVVVAASDAGSAAMAYGAATATVSSLASLLERNIKWRNADVLVEVDFEGEGLLLADITIRAATAILAFAALRAYRRFKRINSAALKLEQQNATQTTEKANGQ